MLPLEAMGRGKYILCLFQFQGPLAFFSLWTHHSSPCLPGHTASRGKSPAASLMRTFVVAFRDLENPRQFFHLKILKRKGSLQMLLRGNTYWFQGLAPDILGGIFSLLQLIIQKHTPITSCLNSQMRIKPESNRSLLTPYQPHSSPLSLRSTVLQTLWLLLFQCQGLRIACSPHSGLCLNVTSTEKLSLNHLVSRSVYLSVSSYLFLPHPFFSHFPSFFK